MSSIQRTRKLALVDCNSFYVSCERLFNPKIRRKPVVVLSNNDGCIISRSTEAKALGIKMGEPYFKAKDIILKNKVEVFSSNYSLYGDLSRRVMRTLKRFNSDMEIYSIDEAFLDLSNFPDQDAEKVGKEIRETVLQWTGIPTSIGIAKTKTLSKIANQIAKKKQSGVTSLIGIENLDPVLEKVEINDVWGVGRHLRKNLPPPVRMLKFSSVIRLRCMLSVWKTAMVQRCSAARKHAAKKLGFCLKMRLKRKSGLPALSLARSKAVSLSICQAQQLFCREVRSIFALFAILAH